MGKYKVVVTGSSGFVGASLIRHLQQNNCEVLTLPHSVLDDVGLIKYKLRNGFDYLYHLAAYGNFYDHINPAQVIESNIVYTHNLLSATRDSNYKGFIYISSSSVYGTKDKPMDELDPIRPDTLYAATKAGAEHICRAYAKSYNLPILTIRPFTVYGPGDNPKHFIPTAINKIKSGEKLTLDPSPVHDYIYIKDLVRILWQLRDEGANYPGEPINVGTGLQYSNQQIATAISKILNKPLDIQLTENIRPYDSHCWVADTQLLNFLGHKPLYTITQGLTETIYGD